MKLVNLFRPSPCKGRLPFQLQENTGGGKPAKEAVGAAGGNVQGCCQGLGSDAVPVHGGQRCEKAVRIGYGDAGFLGQLTAPGGKRRGGVRVFGKLGSHDRGAVGKLLV